MEKDLLIRSPYQSLWVLIRAHSGRTRGSSSKLKEGRFRLKEKIFCNECAETQEQVAREIVVIPIIGNRVAKGFEQPGLVSGVPACSRGIGLGGL